MHDNLTHALLRGSDRLAPQATAPVRTLLPLSMTLCLLTFCLVFSHAFALLVRAASAKTLLARSQQTAAIVIAIYIFNNLTHTLTTQTATHSNVDYTLMTICVYLQKLLIALVSYLAFEGSFSELWSQYNLRFLKLMLGPAFLYAVCDVANFYAQAYNFPGAYMCLLHFRVVPLAIAWQFVMGKKLNSFRWTALLLCVYGSLLKSHVDIERLVVAPDGSSLWHMLKYVPIVVQIICSIFANILNEKLLRDLPQSVLTQSIALYVQGLVALLFLLTPGITHGLVNDGFFPSLTFLSSQMLGILQPAVMVSILTFGFMGVSVGFVLKYTDSLVKELCGIGITCLCQLSDWYVTRLSVPDTLEMVAVGIIVGSITLYTLSEYHDPSQVKAKSTT